MWDSSKDAAVGFNVRHHEWLIVGYRVLKEECTMDMCGDTEGVKPRTWKIREGPIDHSKSSRPFRISGVP
jgi:hypothetical protein